MNTVPHQELTIGNQIVVTAQAHKTYFFAMTNSDGLHGFEWEHFMRTQLVTAASGDTLYVQMSDCQITINGEHLKESQAAFMEHKIFYIETATAFLNYKQKITNITVNKK